MIISSSKIERLKANGVNATFYGTCPSMKQQGKCWETNMILCVSSFCSFNTNNTRDQLPEFRAGSKYLQDDFNILKDWNLGHFSFNQKSQNFQNRGKWYVISLESFWKIRELFHVWNTTINQKFQKFEEQDHMEQKF